MKPVELYCHPSEAPLSIGKLTASIHRPGPGKIDLCYVIDDPDEHLSISDNSGIRRDGLWKETCLEFFLGRASGDDYREFNFSPGGDWAAYAFDRYRQGQRQLLMPGDPEISCTREGKNWVVDVKLALNDLPENGSCNLTAVIIEDATRQTHWAALHAPGRPDFHDRHCFAVAFPSLEQA